MTKEEFYKLATSPKEIAGFAIYRLTIYIYRSESKKYKKNGRTGNWYLRLYHDSNLYSSKELATEALITHIKELSDSECMHSALIQKIWLDRPFEERNVMRWWLYDANGNEIDHSVCSDRIPENLTIHDVYFGRNPEEIRFKAGDIVEVLYDDTVYLSVLNDVPATIEQMWEEHYKRCERRGEPAKDVYDCDHFRDAMSDGYWYMQDNGIDIDEPTYRFMRPTFEPSPEAKEKLTSLYKRWKENVDDAVSGKITWEELTKIVKG